MGRLSRPASINRLWKQRKLAPCLSTKSFYSRPNLVGYQVEIRTPNVVEFVYKKDDGKTDWRKIDILEEDKYYVKGHDINDNNSFKSFKKTNIVGGRMIKH